MPAVDGSGVVGGAGGDGALARSADALAGSAGGTMFLLRSAPTLRRQSTADAYDDMTAVTLTAADAASEDEAPARRAAPTARARPRASRVAAALPAAAALDGSSGPVKAVGRRTRHTFSEAATEPVAAAALSSLLSPRPPPPLVPLPPPPPPAVAPDPLDTLAVQVSNALRICWSGGWAVLTPSRLLKSVWRSLPQFRSYRQQDSQE
jgi:hypothetical protein